MAGSSSFSSLARMSKRGSSPTLGSPSIGDEEDIAPSMSIGAVNDSLAALPFPPKNAFSSLSRSAIEKETPVARDYVSEPNPRAHTARVASNPFASLVQTPKEDAEEFRQSRDIKKDIQAVKVVTKLMRGISFHPGNQAEGAIKSSVLRDQLVLAHRAGKSLAEHVTRDVEFSPWVLAQCIEVAAELIAKRSEDGKTDSAEADVISQVGLAGSVFDKISGDKHLDKVIEDLGEDKYQQATSDAVIKDRVSVSLAASVWDIHDHVSRLAFDYGYSHMEVVEMLTKPILEIAMQTNVVTSSLDMKVAHLQGSIRRVAGLIASEYEARTKKILVWIDEGQSLGDLGRKSAAHNKFENEILTEILGVAKRNFYAIEKIAPKMLEDAGSRFALKPDESRERNQSQSVQ